MIRAWGLRVASFWSWGFRVKVLGGEFRQFRVEVAGVPRANRTMGKDLIVDSKGKSVQSLLVSSSLQNAWGGVGTWRFHQIADPNTNPENIILQTPGRKVEL